MPVEIYKGLYVGPGKILLREIDIDTIISLDCAAKPVYIGRAEEYCFDILDFDVEPVSRIGEVLDKLNEIIGSGKKVYLHCRAGCGRTGTVAIAFLITRGYRLSDAYDLYIRKRGCGPEDPKQLRFLEILEKAIDQYGVARTIKILKQSLNLEDFVVKVL